MDKEFDDYWEENWDEQEWAGCKRACRLCYEDAKKEGIKQGMLVAAETLKDIVMKIRKVSE